MSQSAADQLLAALAHAVGSPLEYDDTNQCALRFDPDIDVIVAYTPEAEQISVRSPVIGTASSDPAELPHQYAQALALNYGRLPPGCSVALDQPTGWLALFASMPVGNVLSEDFLAIISTFVELTPEIRQQLTGHGLQTQASAAEDAPAFSESAMFAMSRA